MAAPDLDVYNGTSWLDVPVPKVYNGSAWQAVTSGWVSQGASTWAQWKSGVGVISCGPWSKNAGTCTGCPSSCSCSQETHYVPWTVISCNFSIHHVHVYRSENGGSYTSSGESNCGTSLTVNNGHYYLKPGGHTDTYNYRVEHHLDSDHSLIGSACFAGLASSFFHEPCSSCSGA